MSSYLDIIENVFQKSLSEFKIGENVNALKDAEIAINLCLKYFIDAYRNRNHLEIKRYFEITENLISLNSSLVQFRQRTEYTNFLKSFLLTISKENNLFIQDELSICLKVVKENDFSDEILYTILGNLLAQNCISSDSIADEYGDSAIWCYKKSVLLGKISNLLFIAKCYDSSIYFYKKYESIIFDLFLMEVEDKYNKIDLQYSIIKYIFNITKSIQNIEDKRYLRFIFLLTTTCINNIKAKLIYTVDKNVAHYSSIETLINLVKDNARFRLYNVKYMNDPSEGTILPKLLKKISSNKDNKFLNHLIDDQKTENNRVILKDNKTYIGSFSIEENKLQLWTLYGKNAEGCSLIFSADLYDNKKNDLDFFNINYDHHLQPQYNLYEVKYIDLQVENGDINLVDTSIQIELNKLTDHLDILLKNFEIYNDTILNISDILFGQIKYLFKIKDYEFEKEVRIIAFADDSIINIDDNIRYNSPRLYIEVEKPLEFDEVILGPKVNRADEMAPFLIHTGKIRKVTKSNIQFK